MSTISFTCPECSQPIVAPIEQQPFEVNCPHCQSEPKTIHPQMETGFLQKCMVCPSSELFVRKDFPQRLGVAIVATGFIISSVFWFYHHVVMTFAVLMLTALIDVVLYALMGNVLECYRCQAQYRGLPGFEEYDAFDMEAYEKHRQQAIRLQMARDEQAAAAASSAGDQDAKPAEQTADT